MIKTISTFLLVLAAWVAQAQCLSLAQYQANIAQVIETAQQKKYDQAFDLLLNMKDKRCESLNEAVDKQVAKLYNYMQSQEGRRALKSTQFDFNKFAIHFYKGKYFFADKAGNPIEKLGKWKSASRFGRLCPSKR